MRPYDGAVTSTSSSQPADPIGSERVRARWTRGLLITCLVVDLAGIASGLAQRALLLRMAAGEQVPTAVAQANDTRHAAIGKLQIIAFLITVILWFAWQSRAYRNLRLVGSGKTRFTQGWAIGYWFIPFVNLVRPYQIIADLWLRSENQNADDTTTGRSAPTAVSLWWGGYLVAGIMGRVVMTMSLNATTIEQLQTATVAGMLGDALGVLSAFLAIRVVKGIDQYQQRFIPAVAGSSPGQV